MAVISGYRWILLEMAGNGLKWLERLEITENNWKWLKIARTGWKKLEIKGMDKNGWN